MQKYKFSENAFDWISLVASVWVMLAHTVAWLGYNGTGSQFPLWMIIAPGPAVVILFAMSGFLVAASYERSATVVEFYKKRILRIYPPLLVVLIMSAIIFCASGHVNESISRVVKDIALGALLGRKGVVPEGGFGNGSLWTIPIQMQFYFLLPLIMEISKRIKQKAVFFGGGVLLFLLINLFNAAIVSCLPGIIRKIYTMTCVPYLYMFMIGIGVYFYQDKVIPFFVRRWKIFFVLYVLIHWLIRLDEQYTWTYINPISSILICSILFGLAYAFGKRRLKLDVSFGIYLIHMPMADLIRNIIGIKSSVASLIMCWCGTLCVAMVLHLFVEKKFTTFVSAQLKKRNFVK